MGFKAKTIATMSTLLFNYNYYFYIQFLLLVFLTNFTRIDLARSLLYNIGTSFMHLQIYVKNKISKP